MNPEHFDFGASKRKQFGESSFQRVYRAYKASAKRRNFEFNLEIDVFQKLTQSNCHYCGIKPLQKMKAKDANEHYLYNGIDRKNSTVGYHENNCVPCCGTCNKAKSNLTENEWNSWILRIVNKFNNEHDEMPKSLITQLN